MSLRTTAVHEQKPLTSGQVVTLQVPQYGKIHSLALRFTNAGAVASEANIRSSIANIRLTFNGKDIVNCSATQLYDLYEALGVQVATAAGFNGSVELNLGPLLMVDPAARKALGFGTKNLNSIQVQVTCGTLTSIDAVQAFTERTAIDEVLGLHCKFLNYPQSFNSTGDHTVDTLPRDPNINYLMVMTDDGSAGTITFGEAKLNNATIIERQPSDMNALLMSNKRITQPAGYYVYNFQDGDFSMVTGVGLPMYGVTDLRFKTTFSVAPGAGGYNMAALTLENVPAPVQK